MRAWFTSREWSITNVLAVVCALWLGAAFGPAGEVQTVVRTQYDTVPPAGMAALIQSLQIERNGLRAKLEGRRQIEPVVVVRTDTLYREPPSDTVVIVWRLTAAGDLKTGLSIRVDTAWGVEYMEHDLPSNCDDGMSWANGSLVCDPARLGHLYLFGAAGGGVNDVGTPYGDLGAGIYWEPSYRSPWRVSAMRRYQGWDLWVSRGWRLF